jgi:hypothetical protein
MRAESYSALVSLQRREAPNRGRIEIHFDTDIALGLEICDWHVCLVRYFDKANEIG